MIESLQIMCNYFLKTKERAAVCEYFYQFSIGNKFIRIAVEVLDVADHHALLFCHQKLVMFSFRLIRKLLVHFATVAAAI